MTGSQVLPTNCNRGIESVRFLCTVKERLKKRQFEHLKSTKVLKFQTKVYRKILFSAIA